MKYLEDVNYVVSVGLHLRGVLLLRSCRREDLRVLHLEGHC
jgi:hypothetical protein